MNIIRCANGHFFDGDKYQTCPHCGAAANMESSAGNTSQTPKAAERHFRQPSAAVAAPDRNSGKTFGLFSKGRASDNDSSNKTQPLSFQQRRCPSCGQMISASAGICDYCGAAVRERSSADRPNTIPKKYGKEPKASETPYEPGKADRTQTAKNADAVSASPAPAAPNNASDSAAPSVTPNKDPEGSTLAGALKSVTSGDRKTIGFFSMGTASETGPDADFIPDPVVGWLLGIKGRHLGDSFNLHSGRNSIGRDATNRIVLSRDGSVSREKHAWITYEPKSRSFYISPGEGSGLVYLNGNPLMSAEKVAYKNKIEIGGGIYTLIPLCSEHFSWETFMK